MSGPVELQLSLEISVIVSVGQRKVPVVEGTSQFLPQTVVLEIKTIPLPVIVLFPQTKPRESDVCLPLPPLVNLAPIVLGSKWMGTHGVDVGVIIAKTFFERNQEL